MKLNKTNIILKPSVSSGCIIMHYITVSSTPTHFAKLLGISGPLCSSTSYWSFKHSFIRASLMSLLLRKQHVSSANIKFQSKCVYEFIYGLNWKIVQYILVLHHFLIFYKLKRGSLLCPNKTHFNDKSVSFISLLVHLKEDIR